MDEPKMMRWQSLVDGFNLDKPGAVPWDAPLLDRSSKGASHGELCTIQFLLNVWSPHDDWQCGKFDLIDAYGVWDEAHQRAFLTWASNPWWP